MKNLTIKFDKEDSDKRTSRGWNWFLGTAYIKEKSFIFTLLEMNTKVGGQNTIAQEITWVNDIPIESGKIEPLIEREFEKEFS